MQRLTFTVHEVFFRKFTEEKAQSLGLSGWVKNEENGTVIGVAEGDSAKIKEFRVWLNTGSPMSSVSRVEDKRVPKTTATSGKPTAGTAKTVPSTVKVSAPGKAATKPRQ